MCDHPSWLQRERVHAHVRSNGHDGRVWGERPLGELCVDYLVVVVGMVGGEAGRVSVFYAITRRVWWRVLCICACDAME